MRYRYLILILIMTTLPRIAPRQFLQQSAGAMGVIDWPVTGELIQGAVVVRGSTPIEGLRYYEVDYALSSDPNQVWVLVQEGTTPIQNGILAVWDTTSIPDGQYNLRLLIDQTNGDQSVTNMYNLQVQNNARLEPTHAPATAWYVDLTKKTPTPLDHFAVEPTMPAASFSVTLTPLPQNPVEITPLKATQALGSGAVLSTIIFILLGIYIGIRHLLNRK